MAEKIEQQQEDIEVSEQASVSKETTEVSEELLVLQNENQQLKTEVARLKEVAQSIQAEFDNYRKRTLLDNEQCKVKAAASVVNAVLPGFDSIDEAIKMYSSKEGKQELAEGFEKVQKQLLDALGSVGVGVMDCEGKEFDPNFHEAVMMQESKDVSPGIILTVFRKGYTYKDSVVRHAQVIVSK